MTKNYMISGSGGAGGHHGGVAKTKIGGALTYVPGFWSVKDLNSTVLTLIVTG